jgi:predicted double-glycine peptidase
MHDTTSIAIQGQISFGLNHTSIDNLITLAEAMETNKESELKNLRTDLVSLLQVKLEALEHLHDLQNSYANNVEVGDAATLDDLQRISAKVEQFKEFLQGHSKTSSSKADALRQELNESVTELPSARSTFERFRAAADERHNVFANFEGGNTGGIDIQDNFRSALLTHLSQQIVVKEHRDRYQFE